MRLHRIQLHNYRGVDKADIHFDSNGVTIIEGDNEVGKTSITEALRLVTMWPDDSKRSDIQDIKPVSRDVGPEVELELTSGDYEVNYHKRWLRSPMTELRVSGKRLEQLSGREAHQRMEAILKETIDEDLWSALKLDQGHEIGLPSFAALGPALDRAASSSASSQEEDSLADRIRTERRRYWTEKRGDASGDRPKLLEDFNTAHSLVVDLQAELDRVEHNLIERERAGAEAVRYGGLRAQADRRHEQLSTDLAAAEKLDLKAQNLGSRLQIADDALDRLADRLRSRKNLIEQQRDLTNARAEHASAEKEDKASLKEADAQLDQAEAAFKAARDEEVQRKQRLRTIEVHTQYLTSQQRLERLARERDAFLQAQRAYDDADAIVERSVVSDELHDEIATAERAFDRANSAVQSAAFSIETTALQTFDLQVNGETLTLNPDQAHEESVDDELQLIIGDLARIRISASDDARTRLEQRDQLLSTYRDICRRAGVSNLTAARNANAELHDAERARQSALNDMDRALDGSSFEQLQLDIDELTQQLDAHVLDPSLPSDLTSTNALSRDHREASEVAEEQLKQLEQQAQAARQAAVEAGSKATSSSAALRNANEQLHKVQAQIANERQSIADDMLRSEFQQTEQKAVQAKQAYDEAQEHLQLANLAQLQEQSREAEAARRDAEQNEQFHRERAVELQGHLNNAGSLGLRTQLDDAKRHLAAVERDYKRTEQQAEAARLLSEVFERHRSASRSRHIEPFRQRIDQLGRSVFGKDFSARVNDDLSVTERTLNGTTLPVDQLSTGAKEQLAVICRLACAALVSPEDGGAPVIIDDALGWSDPQRLALMGETIAAVAGEQCQVILLTCTPGRYEAIPNATVRQLS